jgi:imidazolonepropionase-like amidohydrolase
MKRVISGGLLIDGVHEAAIPHPVVQIEDGQITAIDSRDQLPPDGEHIDLGDLTLMPGFIDTHLHLVGRPAQSKFFDSSEDDLQILLRAAGNAQQALRAGVTNDLILALREAIRTELIVGPRILASGAAIMPAEGHGIEIGRAANNAEELRTAVREQIAAGVDFIKIMATGGGGDRPGSPYYSADELRVVVEEAGRANKRVAAHAHGAAGIRNCVQAGIQRIEHCSFFGDGGSEFDPQLAEAVVDHNIYVSPTNVIDYRRIEKGGRGAPRAILVENWRALLRAGAKFAASSDAGVTDLFYDDYALIPELMVRELGLSPRQAIAACTRVAAEALDLIDEIGTIEPGKCADLVAVRGNPIEDISAMRQVRWVMRHGRVVQEKRS